MISKLTIDQSDRYHRALWKLLRHLPTPGEYAAKELPMDLDFRKVLGDEDANTILELAARFLPVLKNALESSPKKEKGRG